MLNDLPQRRPALYYVGPVIAWAALIFYVSHQKASSLPSVSIPFSDKIAHGAVYGILGLLAGRAFGRGQSINWRQVFVAWALVALYGVSDECHQIFVEGRSCELADWVLDVIGGIAGLVFWKRLLFPFLRRRIDTQELQ